MDTTDWTSDANQAIEIILVQPGTPDSEAITSVEYSFHPLFTYPIFGEKETIYGYKELSVKLYFRSDNMSPALQIQYDKMLESKGGLIEGEDVNQADDARGMLEEHLPEGCLSPCFS